MLRSKATERRAVLLLCAVIALSSCETDRPKAVQTTSSGLERVALVQDPGQLGVGRTISIPKQESLDGTSVEIPGNPGSGGVLVIAMTSAGCPVSTKYAPRLAAMESEFAARGVRFVYVN